MEQKTKLPAVLFKALVALFTAITVAGFYVGYLLAAKTFGTETEATITIFAYGAVGLLVACLVTGTLYLIATINSRLSQISEQLHHIESKE